MKKIKYLKINNEIYFDIYEIARLLENNNLYWIYEAETENACLEIKDGVLYWYAGKFYYGTWVYGIFVDGIIYYADWKDGIFVNGKIMDITWEKGTLMNADYKKGEFLGGDIRK